MDSTASPSVGAGPGSCVQQECSQVPPSSGVDATVLATRALGKALQSQDGGLKQLLTKAAHVECLTEKLRSEQAKEAIKELLAIIVGMMDSRIEVTRAFNQVVAQVKTDLDSRSHDLVVKPPKSTLDAETQSPCWWEMSPTIAEITAGVTMEVAGRLEHSSWAEVTRKKKTKSVAATPAAHGVASGTVGVASSNTGAAVGVSGVPPRTAGQRVRSRPAAILVDVKPEDFPALAKKIRGGVDHVAIGDRVIGMRQAKAGGLLIEVRGDVSQVEAVRTEIARSAGEDVTVKTLQQNSLLEIRDRLG